jgi:hypothetical protein
MVANLSSLSETVDRTTTDRKLADEIQQRLPQIEQDIQENGFSLIEVDGKTFRIEGDIPGRVIAE